MVKRPGLRAQSLTKLSKTMSHSKKLERTRTDERRSRDAKRHSVDTLQIIVGEAFQKNSIPM
eukprot:scaffold430042_cov18-Prasinocladus_malaysianus.AAC.1